jgi:kynurenine formamidase
MNRTILCSLATISLFASSCASNGGSAETVDPATVEAWMDELSNWGRWGEDDELGTLNLITPEKRKRAAALVQTGIAVSLSHNLITSDATDNPDPFEHKFMEMGGDGTSFFVGDHYGVSYHGHAHTHMDSLTHMSYKGKLYNGYPQHKAEDGLAPKLAITQVKNGIFTKGVLMDIPRLKGVDYLEPGTAIYPEDLAAWEKKAGITIEPGDVVFIRTGRWAARAENGPWDTSVKSAGLAVECAKWLHEKDIAVLGSDDSADRLPSGIEGSVQPIHQLFIVAMGTPIFDNMDLEALAAEAARQGRWEFLITAAPLAVEGGTGSPLNPIAVF